MHPKLANGSITMKHRVSVAVFRVSDISGRDSHATELGSQVQLG
jgi:hypothetical protein